MKVEGQRNPPRTGDSMPLPGDRRTSQEQGSAERKEEGAQGRTSLVDINLNSDDSFPASDAPSWSPTTAGGPCPDGSDDCLR